MSKCMVKLIKASSVHQLETRMNEFIENISPEDYVSNVQICCSPNIYGNDFVGMVFVVRRED